MVLDAFAKASNIVFEDKRYGFVAETSLKGRKVLLLKPTTFMNLSGNAVRYWLNKENIDQQRLLVVSDPKLNGLLGDELECLIDVRGGVVEENVACIQELTHALLLILKRLT
jgi:hypothetical protein